MSWTVSCLVLSVLSLSPRSVTTASGQGHMTDAIRTLRGGVVGQCPSMEERERARSELHQVINSVFANTLPTTTPASITTMPSSTTSAITVPTMTDCGGPGWRRVAFINMTDTSYNCPTGLNLTSYSKRTCGQSLTSGGCSSTTFSVGGLPYSRVCGRIRAYQLGGPDAFYYYTQGIDSYYVDGVSLTHGGAGRRQHIWTFAAGGAEVSSSDPWECPCDNTANYDRVPAFVGNDYFCESGLHSAWMFQNSLHFYSDDVLWDGQNCTSTSTCCQFNNPPWFTKNLPNATTDYIELRICTPNYPSNADVPLELIELYVQ